MQVELPGFAQRFLRGAGLGNYGWLLLALLFVICLAPILQEHQYGPRIGDFVIGVVIIAGVFAVMGSLKRGALLMLLSGGAIGLRALNAFGSSVWIAASTEALTLVFLAYVFVIILQNIFRNDVVSIDTLVGSVCAYLVLAMIFASVYTFLLQMYPNSLLMALTSDPPAEPAIAANYGLPAYFSIITLTTVGFGDVVPNHPFVRSIAAVEAIAGQAYLALIVARLMGMHLLRLSSSETNHWPLEQSSRD